MVLNFEVHLRNILKYHPSNKKKKKKKKEEEKRKPVLKSKNLPTINKTFINILKEKDAITRKNYTSIMKR